MSVDIRKPHPLGENDVRSMIHVSLISQREDSQTRVLRLPNEVPVPLRFYFAEEFGLGNFIRSPETTPDQAKRATFKTLARANVQHMDDSEKMLVLGHGPTKKLFGMMFPDPDTTKKDKFNHEYAPEPAPHALVLGPDNQVLLWSYFLLRPEDADKNLETYTELLERAKTKYPHLFGKTTLAMIFPNEYQGIEHKITNENYDAFFAPFTTKDIEILVEHIRTNNELPLEPI